MLYLCNLKTEIIAFSKNAEWQTAELRKMAFLEEIERRRTFGIISHPDAGKTTLTEKLLLFGGAIQEAGAVKNNKIKKGALSLLQRFGFPPFHWVDHDAISEGISSPKKLK